MKHQGLNLRPERTNLRLERANSEPERAESTPKSVVLRSGRPDLRPERVNSGIGIGGLILSLRERI